MSLDLVTKRELVGKLSNHFKSSNIVFFADYKGTSCQDLSDLRNDLRQVGAAFAVVKNTLGQLAIEGTENELGNKFFCGPTAVVWGEEDPVVPAKILKKFAEDSGNFSIKGGVIHGSIVDEGEINLLAEMPSKDELYAKLLSLINAPATRLLQTINAPAENTVRLISVWKNKLEEEQ